MFESDNNKQEVKRVIEVTAARKTKNDNIIMFDMKLNGVSISGCMLKEVTVKNDGPKHKAGDKCYIVDLPKRKNGDKYYNIVWYPINNTDTAEIIKQIKEKI